MSKHVCVLAPWEVSELVEKGEAPTCSQHRHVRVSEAEEMTCKNGRLYHKPIAEWVGTGRKHIRTLVEHHWVCQRTEDGKGPVVVNLVEK